MIKEAFKALLCYFGILSAFWLIQPTEVAYAKDWNTLQAEIGAGESAVLKTPLNRVHCARTWVRVDGRVVKAAAVVAGGGYFYHTNKVTVEERASSSRLKWVIANVAKRSVVVRVGWVNVDPALCGG